MSYEDEVERDAKGIPCECGGYMDRVETTPEERAKYACNPFQTGECCARAFVCRACKKRKACMAEAPEME